MCMASRTLLKVVFMDFSTSFVNITNCFGNKLVPKQGESMF